MPKKKKKKSKVRKKKSKVRKKTSKKVKKRSKFRKKSSKNIKNPLKTITLFGKKRERELLGSNLIKKLKTLNIAKMTLE